MSGSVINQSRPSLWGYPRNLHQALQPLPLPSGGGLNDPRQQWNMTGGLLPAPVGSLLTSKSCATINLTSLLFSLTLCPQYCSSLTSFFSVPFIFAVFIFSFWCIVLISQGMTIHTALACICTQTSPSWTVSAQLHTLAYQMLLLSWHDVVKGANCSQRCVVIFPADKGRAKH